MKLRYVVEHGSFFYIVHDIVNNEIHAKFKSFEDALAYTEWKNDKET